MNINYIRSLNFHSTGLMHPAVITYYMHFSKSNYSRTIILVCVYLRGCILPCGRMCWLQPSVTVELNSNSAVSLRSSHVPCARLTIGPYNYCPKDPSQYTWTNNLVHGAMELHRGLHCRKMSICSMTNR